MPPTISPYPVIYAFGDSLSDAGDAYLLTSSPAASLLGESPEPVSPPYYQETYGTAAIGGSTTSNVFSDGPVWVQDLAALYGLAVPEPGEISGSASSFDALLTSQGIDASTAGETVAGLEFATGEFSGTIQVAGIPGGTDFAIGGSVTGLNSEDTGVSLALTDLKAQLTYFQNSIPQPAADALYTVWSGSNDLLDLLESSDFSSLSTDIINADISASVSNEVTMMQSLAADGAQSILVLNVPDLGKTPEVAALGAAAEGTATQLAQTFNSALAAALNATSFGSTHVYQENVFALIDDAVANPSTYGLNDVTDPVYTGSLSQDTGTTVATGQDQYLFFDKLHPTSTGHNLIATNAETVLSALCYCPGTHILTEGGEQPVETLAVGDRVVTYLGGCEPVRWIGRRSYGAAFVAGNHLMLPVCIKAGALADATPGRDLWVSPGHGLFIDGVLVAAWRLVNGRTVVQRAAAAAGVEYLHIELASHDIILAEGTPAESFLDEGGRAQFANAAEHAALYADGVGGPVAACAPRVEDGFHLQAIQRRVDARAGLAPAPGRDGALRGFVDVAGPQRVCGWAQDLDAPEAAVCLDVVLEGRRVMRVLANRYRADLRQGGMGSGCHAFDVALPAGLAGCVEVRRSSDHAPLALTEAAVLAAAA